MFSITNGEDSSDVYKDCCERKGEKNKKKMEEKMDEEKKKE